MINKLSHAKSLRMTNEIVNYFIKVFHLFLILELFGKIK